MILNLPVFIRVLILWNVSICIYIVSILLYTHCDYRYIKFIFYCIKDLEIDVVQYSRINCKITSTLTISVRSNVLFLNLSDIFQNMFVYECRWLTIVGRVQMWLQPGNVCSANEYRSRLECVWESSLRARIYELVCNKQARIGIALQ